LVGVKGKAGRKRKFNDPLRRAVQKYMLEYYYKNREKRLAYGREYHKRIKTYADAHGISFEEAKRQLRLKKEQKK